MSIFLSGLAFCGCSQKEDAATGPAIEQKQDTATGPAIEQKQDAAARPAIDLVVAGQELSWADGYVLYVTKREGNSVEGIQVLRTASNGQQTAIVADKGTIAAGADRNSVTLALYEAKVQRGATQTSAHLMNLVLTR